MDVLSDRWTFLILREAFFGVRRYGQMQRNLGIARNVLADRLRQLVADGMFERVRYRTDPDWYEYRLTERALDLYPAIVALMRWADKHLAAEDNTDVLELIHRTCGEPARPLSGLLALPRAADRARHRGQDPAGPLGRRPSRRTARVAPTGCRPSHRTRCPAARRTPRWRRRRSR